MHGFSPPTLRQTIENLIERRLQEREIYQGHELSEEHFAEEDDFSLDDEPQPLSEYQMLEPEVFEPLDAQPIVEDDAPAEPPEGGGPPPGDPPTSDTA